MNTYAFGIHIGIGYPALWLQQRRLYPLTILSISDYPKFNSQVIKTEFIALYISYYCAFFAITYS